MARLFVGIRPKAAEKVIEVPFHPFVEGDDLLGGLTARGVRWEPSAVVEHCTPVEAINLVVVARFLVTTDVPEQSRHGDYIASRDADEIGRLFIHSVMMSDILGGVRSFWTVTGRGPSAW